MSKLGVICNPTSGSGRGADVGRETLALLASKGHQVVDLSRGSWAGSYETAMKNRRKIDALVVVGGDGMVHLGLQVCSERKLPLGIVAAGSGNDIAIACDLPEYDVPAAVDRIEQGLTDGPTAIDVGKISGANVELPASPRYFGAIMSAGIDAAIAAYAQRLHFPRGPIKYKLATAREVPRYKPYGAAITVDGRTWDTTCTLIAVANGPVFGGGLRLSPDSSILDGKLELVITEPLGRLEIARLFPKLYDGSIKDHPKVTYIQARKMTIARHGGGAPLPAATADGEIVGGSPLTVEVVPGGLRVLGARAK